jgi:hypothetical protein
VQAVAIEGANDLFAEPSEVLADLRVLEGVRWARQEFEQLLIEQSLTDNETTLATLRLEATHNLAEFFYMLKARGIQDGEKMKLLADLHNDYIVKLTRDTAKMSRFGLRKDRLLDAIFTADIMPRLVENWADGRCLIDQSNLARFLVTLMSAETCRKCVVAAEAAGYLRRERMYYGATVIGSTGTIENIFATALRGLRQRLAQGD